jgi:predicted Zn-dependent protease
MRRARWLMLGIFALAMCGVAAAQSANVPQGSFSSALTGIRPTDVQFKQIDTAALARAPVNTLQQTGQSRFSLTNFFRKMFMPTAKPTRGVSPLPDPQSVPGWQFPNSPIKPVQPVIPQS